MNVPEWNNIHPPSEMSPGPLHVLSKPDLSALIETNFSVVGIDEPVQSLIKVISSSNRNTFPVVNGEQQVVGIIHMDNIRSIIFTPEKYQKRTV